MAIILSIIVLQVALLFIYVFYARFYFLLSCILFLLYFILKYYDGDEMTGNRAWPLLRRYTLFGKTVQYYLGNPETFSADQNHDRFLFVVLGNLSNMGLFHGFGMHGGVFKHVDMVYMLPKLLFKIPFLRDFLLWTGAVCQDESNLLKLLKKGKSVVYCPSKMEDLLSYTNPRTDDGLIIHAPNVDVFEFAMKHRIQIIPVLIVGESKRYAFLRGHWVHKLQQYSMQMCGWPFPLLFGPRIFGNRPPPKLEIQVGFPMDASLQESVQSFSKLFMGQFTGLMETGGDSREMIYK